MQAPSLLLLPDRSIGELHPTAIPDQDLMELLIEDMSDDFKNIFQHSSGKYIPVCRWEGVTCNARRNVLLVEFASLKRGKVPSKIDFAYLPRSLVNFDIPLQNLHGTVETSALPRKLELLSLRNNDFHGTFDFRYLPERLRNLDILGNYFSGSVNFEHLPPTIEKIRALDNAFIGCIALDKLPRSLIDLDLSQNKLRGSLNLQSTARDLKVLTLADNAFFGEVCFDHLPQKVEHVFLESNRLCGSIRILRLPESLVGLHLQKNEFFGIAVIRKDLYSHIALQTQHILAVVDENGRAYKRFDRSDSDKVHKDVVAMFGFVTFLDYATRSQFLNSYGQPLALEEWKGVELDSYSRVVAIRFTEDSGVQELKGSICFDHLPKYVKVCEICPDHHTITGVIHTENLPRSLEELIVPSKALSGEFQFERLPMILRNLDISKNHFSGYVVLDSLPINLRILAACFNEFHGSLDLTNLPRNLDILELNNCRFTGTVSLNFLPASLSVLSLSNNSLQGKLRMTRVPRNIFLLNLDKNNFSGTAVLAEGAWKKARIDAFSFDAVVNAEGVAYF